MKTGGVWEIFYGKLINYILQEEDNKAEISSGIDRQYAVFKKGLPPSNKDI